MAAKSASAVLSWRLERATPAQRNRFEIMAMAKGLLAELDEDISIRECCRECRRDTKGKTAKRRRLNRTPLIMGS